MTCLLASKRLTEQDWWDRVISRIDFQNTAYAPKTLLRLFQKYKYFCYIDFYITSFFISINI